MIFKLHHNEEIVEKKTSNKAFSLYTLYLRLQKTKKEHFHKQLYNPQ